MANANFDVISYNSNSYYPRDTVNYLIKGTQTAATNVWTGPLPDGITAYEDGFTIDYFLPYSGNTTPATLNLGGKGAKPIYFNDSSSPLSNQFPQYSVIRLSYVIDSNLNSGNGAWQVVGSSYKTNNITVGSASTTGMTTEPVNVSTDDITAWSAGTTPTLGTAIDADEITAWDDGTMFSASVSGATLNLVSGTEPSLTYSEKSIPNVTNVGSTPSLTYTEKTITITPTTVVTSIEME